MSAKPNRFIHHIVSICLCYAMLGLCVSGARAEEGPIEIGSQSAGEQEVPVLGTSRIAESDAETEAIVMDLQDDGIEAQEDAGVDLAHADEEITVMEDAKTPSISVLTHVQRQGWADSWARDGAAARTIGQSLRMEAIRLRIDGQGTIARCRS